MKHARLSEIDLAKALTIPPGPALDAAMRNYNAGGGPWSYDPTRASTSDLVGARAPLIDLVPEVPWSRLERQIRALCKRGQDQIRSNVEVSKILFEAVRDRGWSAAQEPMGRLSVGFGESVRFWSDVVIADADGPFIPFFDHRRRGGLSSAAARHVVFSMQHIGVRERNPDLADARLAIIRFPTDGTARTMQVYFHKGEELLPYEELDLRVRSVFETWARVSDERIIAKRAAHGGGSTPFGF